MKVHVRFLALGIGAMTISTARSEAAPSPSSPLTLDAYLEEVREANPSLKVSRATVSAGELRSDSTDILFTPQLFSQASHTSDGKVQPNPLAPEKIQATNLTFGIQKLWESGLQSQLSYSMTRVRLDQPGLPSTFNLTIPVPNPVLPGTSIDLPVTVPNPVQGLLPRDEYTEARTQLDLVQPLIKGSGGEDYKLIRETAQTRIAMQKLGETYKTKSLLAQAEYVYWQLALLQEAVRNQEGTIERLRKIRAWTSRRAESQLGDRVDFLQADSGLKAKLFELESTKKERNALQRVFNSLRGIEGGEVAKPLQPLSGKSIIRELKDEGGEVKRLDIEIAKKAERLSQIEVEQSREKYKSQLDVFGSIALNKLDGTPEEALQGSLDTRHPTYVVGVKFSTPLDHQLINRDRQGLVQTSTAQRLDRESKEFTARQDWKDLHAQLDEAEVRLKLAEEMEKAQDVKLRYERQRLEAGRTTTYQILTFENDYAMAQLATIKVKAEILGIQAKLKSFGDAS